jgi:hypothetical protein
MLKEREMMTRREVNTAFSSEILIAASPGLGAQERAIKEFPPARVEGGKPLVETLRLRRSIRDYSERSLPPQVLSDLLWPGYGINRPSGERTAPYWRHIMVIDIYAAMADGLWLYDPKQHVLLPHLKADIRPATGLQDFVATAPLNLVYVAHSDRMKDIPHEEQRLYCLSRQWLHRPKRLSVFALRKGWQPYSAGRSIFRGLRERCNSMRRNLSRSLRLWDIRQPSMPPAGGQRLAAFG